MSSIPSSRTGPPADNRRYHSLDQLRAGMMLLGLVLHSSLSFVTLPLGQMWPYKDANICVLFDILVFFIHLFRMPLFFVMSGFFTAYLYDRRGAEAMLKNRLLRVAIPFALFLPALWPVAAAGFRFIQHGGVHGGWEATRSYFAHPESWYSDLNTMHLWFLYYLIWYYVLIRVFLPALDKVFRACTGVIAKKLGKIIHHPLGILVGIVVTFLMLLHSHTPGLDTDNGFFIQPKILLAYGVFISFGWVLYLNRDQLNHFTDRAWMLTSAGFLLACGAIGYLIVYKEHFPIEGQALVAAAIWTLIYGFIGLSVRYCDQPKPLGRYLADSSYWLYLVHLPITIWVSGLMAAWNAPAIVKMPINLAVVATVSLMTYHYFVRSTLIGVLLNGRRYARGLPTVPASTLHRPTPL